MKLEEILTNDYGYKQEIKDDIKGYIKQWKSWYRGNVRDFHNYFIYNGKKKLREVRYSMQMAKQISEDWSDILWSEKCKISLKNEKVQDELDKLIDELDLYSVINQAIEKSGALGTCACVVSVYDIITDEEKTYLDVREAKTRVDIVDIDNIYPLSWNNKEITDCAFSSVEYRNGDKYIVLSVHKKDDKNGNYKIINRLFKETNGSLVEVTTNETLKEFDTKSNVKWFSIFKPLLTNNLFDNNPFGIPHYANAIDNLKSVDLCFDEIRHEIKDGRRRIFARADMFNYDDGEQKLVFDPNDTLIYQLPQGANKDDLIQTESDNLRTQQQILTLNTCLNMLGNMVGFGENHYHFDGTNLSTATAVISSNSKLFRRKKKLEIGYESSIFDLVQAICYASTQFGQYNIDTEDMVIQFDDSIIEDKESESNRALREVSAGLLSKEEYREKIFGETPEIAKKKIEEIDNGEDNYSEIVGNDEDEEKKDEEK